jgi:hypothetical protein
MDSVACGEEKQVACVAKFSDGHIDVDILDRTAVVYLDLSQGLASPVDGEVTQESIHMVSRIFRQQVSSAMQLVYKTAPVMVLIVVLIRLDEPLI